ncbi:MAG: J domain-containing protein [Firmicutes bacterium]|nr:J domain-containing protein [Bacillota bacterium]
MQDYYEILGLPRYSDSAQDLRKAYKEQVLFFHPDKGNVNASIALERTQLLNEAYKTLKDPEKKAAYDRDLKAYLQRESYAAPKKEEGKPKEEPKSEPEKEPAPEPKAKAEPKPQPKAKPASAPAAEHPFVVSVKKAAERAISIAPTLPKPVIAGLLIVVLLLGISVLDVLYRGISGFIAPGEIDSGIFASDELEQALHTACIPFERYRSRIHETCDFLESDDAGYGSPLFYASEKLIVMDRNAPPQPLILTVDYTGFLGIQVEQDTDAAQIRFSENVWYGKTTQLEVAAEHPGITVFTFGNDRNSTSFRVRVIVL